MTNPTVTEIMTSCERAKAHISGVMVGPRRYYHDLGGRERMGDPAPTFYGMPLVVNPRATGWAITKRCPDCDITVGVASASVKPNDRLFKIVTDPITGRQAYVCATCDGSKQVIAACSDDWNPGT